LLGGCATAAEVTGTATQQDLMRIRADVAALQLANQRSKTDTDTATAQADRRGREQAATAERQIASLTKRLESLSSTLAALTGRVEELNTKVELVNRQLRATAVPRPGAPAPSTPSTPAPPAPGAPSTAPPPSAARPTTGSLQPPDIYQSSYLDFSKGSYALAVAGFREFLRRFPDHDLAGNSQYWIGEAHYSLARGYLNAAQGDKAVQALEQAVTEFRKVAANYPRGGKVPAALFKEALALIDLKQPALAQTRLQYLIDNFPQAEETPLARDRLSSLKSS
jgi:tol-pal system protein YbgF